MALWLLLQLVVAENRFEQVDYPEQDLNPRGEIGMGPMGGSAPGDIPVYAPPTPRKRNVMFNEFRALPSSRCELFTAVLSGVGFVLIGSLALHVAEKHD